MFANWAIIDTSKWSHQIGTIFPDSFPFDRQNYPELSVGPCTTVISVACYFIVIASLVFVSAQQLRMEIFPLQSGRLLPVWSFFIFANHCVLSAGKIFSFLRDYRTQKLKKRLQLMLARRPRGFSVIKVNSCECQSIKGKKSLGRAQSQLSRSHRNAEQTYY